MVPIDEKEFPENIPRKEQRQLELCHMQRKAEIQKRTRHTGGGHTSVSDTRDKRAPLASFRRHTHTHVDRNLEPHKTVLSNTT